MRWLKEEDERVLMTELRALHWVEREFVDRTSSITLKLMEGVVKYYIQMFGVQKGCLLPRSSRSMELEATVPQFV